MNYGYFNTLHHIPSFSVSTILKMKSALALLHLFYITLYWTATLGEECNRPQTTDNIEVEDVQRVFQPGQQVTLSCKQGYRIVSGSKMITCLINGVWTAPTLKCSPKICPGPEAPNNGRLHYTNTVFNSVINYTCDDGYILHGANGAQCLHTGQWSDPPPECKPVTCDLPAIPKYGKIVYDKKLTGDFTELGDGGTYECLPPLVLFGNERATCTARGTWTETPECRLVMCPVPPKIANGFATVAVEREHGYKERVKYRCNDHYSLDGPMVIECERSGQWTERPTCKASCNVDIERGRILYRGRELWIEELQPNQVLHKEYVAVYCVDKAKACRYLATTQCIDGTLRIPNCFEEPSEEEYSTRAESLPSDIRTC